MVFEKEDNWMDALNYKRHGVVWSNVTRPGGIIYSSIVDGRSWFIRLNDFPEEPLFTLLDGDDEVIISMNGPRNGGRGLYCH